MVAFARPALGCAHTVGFTDVFIARDGPPQKYLYWPTCASSIMGYCGMLVELTSSIFILADMCVFNYGLLWDAG